MELENASPEDLKRRSNEIRRGADEDPEIAFELAKRLAAHQYMEHARRLAEHIHTDPRASPQRSIDVRQKWALWTSKNPDGPDDSKHEEALEILDGIKTIEGGESLEQTTDAETLGIAGGICKRLWLVDGQIRSLKRSLRYYERGAAQGIENDSGYTAINAAFVLDVLNSLEQDGDRSQDERASELRRYVVETLLKIQDQPAYEGGPPRGEERWFHETVAEAQFGLGEYEDAKESLGKVDWDAVEPWQRETTARQFAWLAKLKDSEAKSPEDFEASAPWSVLRECFGSSVTAGAASLFSGKLGLALSGGGFRASFFHIGVLAALAELDELRHVEALSCVSGGSIVGAHYYLEIRKLLQNHPDGTISREQYIEVVERLAENFLKGVKTNIRTRVASNLFANFKMIFVPGYTRTNRLGELYEKYLYSQVADADQNGVQERRLRELIVRPKGDENCKPQYDNWRRSDKVPILILNATTVNTGHNWQFTARSMGEPPAPIESRVDGNYRLRRLNYEEAPRQEPRDISIGQAVAASSCVPGLFAPLELRRLYKGITVRLVDGGVHDNQGVFGLLHQNCTVFIVSDASGQMGTEDDPKDNPLLLLMRASSISMARVRTSEYRELESRRRSGRLKGLLFLHLKDELEVQDRDWLGCDNPKQLSEDDLRRARQQLTRYNISKSFQEQISNIRTDLDSFHETEAFALMASGCSMVRTKFPNAIHGFRTDSRKHDWDFLAVAPKLSHPEGSDSGRLAALLRVASESAFKIWRLSLPLKVLAGVLALALLVGLGYAASSWGGDPLLSLKGLAAAFATGALSLLAGGLGLGGVVKLIKRRKTIYQILLAVAICLVGFVLSWIHLGFFDPAYLRRGKLSE